jgi:hypothetical protein
MMKNIFYRLLECYSLNASGGLFILLLLIAPVNLSAQPGFMIYADCAQTVISDGLYMRSAYFGNYELGDYRLNAGIQTNLINRNDINLSGYCIEALRAFKIKKTQIELKGFWLWTASSEFLKEINYGGLVSMNLNHFNMKIGTNFRTYSFRRKALRIYEIRNKENRVHEILNVMYSFSYNIKSSDCKWNAGLRLTNMDLFMINQETNPYINLNGYFKVSSRVSLFAEVWYKSAGATNLNSNYFGYLIRGGIKWNF